MKEFIAHFLISAMFIFNAEYVIWWLFFSKESIIKLKPMKPKTQKQEFNHDESRRKLEKKLAALELQRAQLLHEVVDNYSEKIIRELNIVDHHIEVANQRLNGSWVAEYEFTVKELQ